MSFAYGFDTAGAVDYVAVVSANTSSVWTGLNGVSTTYYLYADRDISTGTITYNKTTTRPIYTNVPGTGNNTYIIPQGKMVNGSSTAIQRLFLGEAATSAGSVISTITPYMPRGEFQSGTDDTFTLADSTETQTHRLGVTPRVVSWVLVNAITQYGYAVGDEIPLESVSSGGALITTGSRANATTLEARLRWSGATPSVLNAAWAIQPITAANWTLRAYAWRGW